MSKDSPTDSTVPSAAPPTPTPKSPEPGPALSRSKLTRVLGLASDATAAEIEQTTPRLLIRLLRRLATAEDSEATALREEIAELERSSALFETSKAVTPIGNDSNQRQSLTRVLLGAAVTLCLLLAYAAGVRITWDRAESAAIVASKPARLILDGPLPRATLHVLDADRDELILKTWAQGASVELAAGRYAIDVRREDCPDQWTRSVYFEEGETKRFEPEVCLGEGNLTVRSNVSGDRLRIDGLDLGATTDRPHLLSVGDHQIRVDKSGYQGFLGQVRIRPNEALELKAELLPGSGEGLGRGRPMPVTKQLPSKAPATHVAVIPFGPADFRDQRQELDVDLSTSRFLPSSLAAKSGGGSTAWHDRVSAQFVSRYDLDDSGQIDQLKESERISCAEWRLLERDFDGGGLGLSMVRYYGFDGSEWHPNALGFARSHRSAVFEQMKECGLQT